MGIELLFVRQRLEMRLDGEWDDTGRTVGEVLLEGLRFYASRHVFYEIMVTRETGELQLDTMEALDCGVDAGR